MTILIQVLQNEEVIVQRTAESFEIAEQNLGSLEREYHKRDSDLAEETEEN